jgi:hypothetical protein
MATLHSVHGRYFPADWETENYSDTTFLAAIAPYATNLLLTDEQIAEMESVTDYMDGEYPQQILDLADFLSARVEDILFIVTDGRHFPKSASEIRSNLSFPVLDNFCYDADLLRAQTRNGIDRTEMLANLR